MGTPLAPGCVIAGRYRLDRVLGQGGMGAVWAATHTVTRAAVAVKFLRGPAHARPDLRRRFLREARAASAVSHPNVVQIRDVFEHDEETPVMVMDLLTGETLGERIQREETLSLAETATLLGAVVSAVGTAHARGVIHRDIKPENIFLVATPSGCVVKVLDFGVARSLHVDGRALERGLVTETGTVIGTPCYMAPEQALGERDIDHRVDLWALGAVLYECLSGARPIEGDSVGQVVKHLMSTGITPLARVALGLPTEVTDLVDRMLSRERGRRPTDLRDVREVLSRYSEAAIVEFGAPGSEASLAPDWEPHHDNLASSSRSSRVPVLGARTSRSAVAVALGALAVAACAGFLFARGTNDPRPSLPLETGIADVGRAAARGARDVAVVVSVAQAVATSHLEPVASSTPGKRRLSSSRRPAGTASPTSIPEPAPTAPSAAPTAGGLADTPPY